MTAGVRRVLVHTSVFPRWNGDRTPPFVFNQCKLLAEQGWDITVIAPHSAGAKFREEIEGMRVIRFPYFWPFKFEQLCYDGGILIQLQRRAVLKYMLPCFFLSQTLALLWCCLRFRPAILHSHSLLPQGLNAVWLGKFLRIPHITTSHGNDVFGLSPDGWMGRMKRFVLRSANAITVNSLATKQAVLELGGAESKIHFIPAVANVGQVDSTIVHTIQEKYGMGPKVLFVGRFIEEKGVLDLLQAFAQMKKQLADAQCIFVGDGVLATEMKTIALDLKVEQAVHFVGWRPGKEIASWMAAADVLVVPSKPVGTWQKLKVWLWSKPWPSVHL
ncbi:glycosyltransferase [Coraliomargarita algicola]|uniref:Glycosyltransferase n=1 Tax=Coraliomargarita algicola TaxID=3092156 RepID=A0ABZ0REV0_9BACT|nr:glycosyltransferase [Coraliomargarita sp. J2-16]WPJ94694.1 glycosyltransferase [Coraliomargarita sp. J2-16]